MSIKHYFHAILRKLSCSSPGPKPLGLGPGLGINYQGFLTVFNGLGLWTSVCYCYYVHKEKGKSLGVTEFPTLGQLRPSHASCVGHVGQFAKIKRKIQQQIENS